MLAATEADWLARYGATRIDALRAALERLVEHTDGSGSLLAEGLKPYADGWRAPLRSPDTLPRCPMVLRRGGYPVGS